MKILTLCRPCAEKLGQAYELTRIITGSEKDTCAECEKRRYTYKYRTIQVACTAKSTLVATNPVSTSLYVGAEPGTGLAQVMEMVPQVPGQIGMDGGQQDEPKILKFANQ